MYSLLPLLSIFLIFLILCLRNGGVSRKYLLIAPILTCIELVIFTEVLSTANRLTFNWLTAVWAANVMLLAAACFGLVRRVRLNLPDFRVPASMIPVVALVLLTGVFAVVFPPNTWDSMTYHMARVAHWQQNGSVDFYPTHIQRQLHQPPFAEYAILHLQILSGGDRLANLIQWLSMIGCLIAVSLVAARLKGAPALAAVFAATLPIGLMQATGTQNDYVLAFWLACCAYFLLLGSSWANAFLAGACLGLAALTKGTAYFFAFPFVLWCVFRLKDWKRVLLVGAVALSLNVTHYVRNYKVYKHPLATAREHQLTNAIYDAKSLVSNVTRNLALHTITPSNSVNQLSIRVIYKLHTLMGLDINDPRTTWQGTRFTPVDDSLHEEISGNPLHLFLIIVSLALLAFGRGSPLAVKYSLAVAGAFLVFCLILKWQPWHSRLHLPLFILFAPVVGGIMARYNRTGRVVIALLLMASIPVVWESKPRSFVYFRGDRLSLYFLNRPDLQNPYVEATRRATTGCSRVGLVTDGDGWEYPLWVLSPGTHYEHVQVTNSSRWAERGEFVPCAIICTAPGFEAPPPFHKEWESQTVSVYR